MQAVFRGGILPDRAWRVVAHAAASPGMTLPALLLGAALMAVPANADDRPAAVPIPVGLQVLDTSRPPDGGNWVVLDAAEDASWRARGGERWLRFQPGQVVLPGSEIETGPGGDVVLVVGGDQVRIAPGTRLVLPAAVADGPSLRHERGRLRVDVERRSGRRFSVTMPLLSLGIKGTSFETAVGRNEDAVVVLDGEVEVRPVGREELFRLRAGQGLRQPAAAGAEPLRFELPPAVAAQGRDDPMRWHLQAPSRAHSQDEPGWRSGDGAAAAQAARSTDRDRARGAASSSTWSENGISMLIVATLVTAVVLLLAGPLIDLFRNIFDLDRPVAGRRRRDLTRG